MKTLNRRMAVLAIAAAPLASPRGSDEDSPTAPTTGTAQVRVAHLSPDAPPVDVYVNGARAVTGAAFKDGHELPLRAGGFRQLRVTPAGATSPAVIDATVTLNNGGSYTVAATGLLAGIQPIVLEDDRGTTGQSKVRFVHASPDAPAVDIAVTGGPVLFANVPSARPRRTRRWLLHLRPRGSARGLDGGGAPGGGRDAETRHQLHDLRGRPAVEQDAGGSAGGRRAVARPAGGRTEARLPAEPRLRVRAGRQRIREAGPGAERAAGRPVRHWPACETGRPRRGWWCGAASRPRPARRPRGRSPSPHPRGRPR